MINSQKVLDSLPNTNGCVVSVSGGMDSTIALRFCVEKYGSANVHAMSFFYGPRQSDEIRRALITSQNLGCTHTVIDLQHSLGEMSRGFSANVDQNIQMPTIKDVIGSPTPITYVPNRNMILASFAAAYAETRGVNTIVMGVQATDQYNYWDTTKSFVDRLNAVFAENRKTKINLISPFVDLSKVDELKLLLELDDNVNLLKNTLTCYNPNKEGDSCGKCPSCAERIAAFMKCGLIDPIKYSININWKI